MSNTRRIAFSLILALPNKNVKASSVAAIILVEYEKRLLLLIPRIILVKANRALSVWSALPLSSAHLRTTSQL